MRYLTFAALFAYYCVASTYGKEPSAEFPAVTWQTDYAEAMRLAKQDSKMLLVLFGDSSATAKGLQARVDSDKNIEPRLAKFTFLKVSVAAKIKVSGEDVTLIKHAAFSELAGTEGFAIIDFAHADQEYYGRVVSVFPFPSRKYYRFRLDHLPTIMNLPAGTLTQRSMIYAVRVHPERPASTRGVKDAVLTQEATSHSTYQAQIRVQGHHRWESRFHRIIGRLVGIRPRQQVTYRALPVEVVAESWPNQDLMDSCVDCVHSWRQSSGHWSAVKASHVGYGYDIRRGGNGIWYATGIFSN